jgi:hypothetical protein
VVEAVMGEAAWARLLEEASWQWFVVVRKAELRGRAVGLVGGGAATRSQPTVVVVEATVGRDVRRRR